MRPTPVTRRSLKEAEDARKQGSNDLKDQLWSSISDTSSEARFKIRELKETLTEEQKIQLEEILILKDKYASLKVAAEMRFVGNWIASKAHDEADHGLMADAFYRSKLSNAQSGGRT